MMITAIYYTKYSDTSPIDPTMAGDLVYFEVAEVSGDIENFDYTYTIEIYTVKYVEAKIREFGFFISDCAVIVGRFDYPDIKAALEAILPKVDEYARRME